ncbi:MAG: hypothetical protein II817_03025 [Bacteroidales bacterium]|nr:hypothetical protein [Bacteroidales bacterium]
MIATIILLFLQALGLGAHLAKHGEKDDSEYNFWNKLLAVCVILILYYYAGLFNNFR